MPTVAINPPSTVTLGNNVAILCCGKILLASALITKSGVRCPVCHHVTLRSVKGADDIYRAEVTTD